MVDGSVGGEVTGGQCVHHVRRKCAGWVQGHNTHSNTSQLAADDRHADAHEHCAQHGHVLCCRYATQGRAGAVSRSLAQHILATLQPRHCASNGRTREQGLGRTNEPAQVRLEARPAGDQQQLGHSGQSEGEEREAAREGKKAGQRSKVLDNLE